jgi:hypothetical protein
MTDTPNEMTTKTEPRTGGAVVSFAPKSLDEAFRLAKALSMSGNMVPTHFQNEPEMTMAAIIRGQEIGLSPMQALSNIAVINGRASLWGDCLPAMMQRAGHSIDVEVTGEGDKMVATATLTRGDTGKELVRTFSVAEAKKAGLWEKKGPWQQYPNRMLGHRARAWAVRDGAADALMGLQIAEETSDYQSRTKDVTPKAAVGGWGQKAMNAREPAPEETPHDPETGEVQNESADEIEDAEISAEYDEDSVDPMTDEYDEGFKASKLRKAESFCPHESGSFEWNNWLGGYRFHAAKSEDEG